MTWKWLKDVFTPSTSGQLDTSDIASENQLFSFLIALVNREDRIKETLSTYYTAINKSAMERQGIVLDTYFTLEKFLTTQKPLVVKKSFTKKELRTEVLHQPFFKQLSPRLKLIFLPPQEQTLAIAAVALSDIASVIVNSIGITRLVTIINQVKHAERFEGIDIDKQTLQVQFTPSERSFIQGHSDYRNLMRLLLIALVSELEQSLGKQYAQQSITKIFAFFQKHYGDYDIIAALLGLMPTSWMEQERLALLNRSELARLVQEKTAKLLHAEAEKRVFIEHYNKKLELEVRERTEELKKVVTRLKELDELKTEFLNLAAHELRTPLTVISWIYSEMLAGELGTITHKQRSVLQEGFERTRYMINLVGDLLNVSRIEDKKIPALEREPLQINLFLSNIIKDFQEQAQAKHIALLSTIDETLPLGWYDIRQLKIAISNLLNNAVKYTPAEGTITMKTEQQDTTLVITIHDTGIGIPTGQLPYVFTKFFRAKNAIATNTTGSGLGLYISKSIIERHGGTITVDSIENKGTTFTIKLPFKDPEQEKPLPPNMISESQK